MLKSMYKKIKSFFEKIYSKFRKSINYPTENTTPEKTTYKITDVVTGTVTYEDSSIIQILDGGRFEEATIIGKELQVVCEDDRCVFKSCDFSQATFVNSSLKATNFGMVSDLTFGDEELTLKGQTLMVGVAQGTDNRNRFNELADFLNNSDGIKIQMNGDFYSSTKQQTVGITNASNLEIYGGTIIMGLTFINCHDCYFHDMYFMGYHGLHPFPPIYSNKKKLPITINGVEYTSENSLNRGVDKLCDYGIASDAIFIYNDPDVEGSSYNFKIESIYCVMRQMGITVGSYTQNKSGFTPIKDVEIKNCNCENIFFQPYGFHAQNVLLDNCTGRYCLQPVDISTGSGNVTVKDCIFWDCASGIKQECGNSDLRDYSHDNKIINCKLFISDQYMILDASQYTLNIAEGAVDDTFTVEDTKFYITKERPCVPFMTRSANMIMKDCTISVDITLPENSNAKYEISRFFSVYGQTERVGNPKLRLENVQLVLNENPTVLYLFDSYVSGLILDVTTKNFDITGGTIKYYNSELAQITNE